MFQRIFFYILVPWYYFLNNATYHNPITYFCALRQSRKASKHTAPFFKGLFLCSQKRHQPKLVPFSLGLNEIKSKEGLDKVFGIPIYVNQGEPSEP